MANENKEFSKLEKNVLCLMMLEKIKEKSEKKLEQLSKSTLVSGDTVSITFTFKLND